MFQNEYRKMNEKIALHPALQEAVLEKAVPKRQLRVRAAVVIAAVLALVFMTIPAMAAYVPAVSELMYQVSPEMAARFTPVQKSCTKDGIRMEVVSASVHGATAEVCISFEDMEGNRIDGQLRTDGAELLGKKLFLTGTWGGGIGDFNYDAATGKAIMVIDQNYSFYSSLKDRYLTVDELFDGKITVSIDRLYRYVSSGGVWVEETLAEGPWIVSFQISESDYVGQGDDGVPQMTGEE